MVVGEVAHDGNTHKINTVSTVDVSYMVGANTIDHVIVPACSQGVFQDALGRVASRSKVPRSSPSVHAASTIWEALSMAYLNGALGEEVGKAEEEEKKQDKDEVEEENEEGDEESKQGDTQGGSQPNEP